VVGYYRPGEIPNFSSLHIPTDIVLMKVVPHRPNSYKRFSKKIKFKEKFKNRLISIQSISPTAF